jgi:hypothetical protein
VATYTSHIPPTTGCLESSYILTLTMYLLQFLNSPRRFHEGLCFWESHPPFVDLSIAFQKGDIILILINFPMRDLRRHRENHNFSLLSLTPVTFDFNTFSCYGGSYFATIAVVSHIFRRPLNLARLSRPTTPVMSITYITSYCSEYVPPQNRLLPLSRPPPRALQLSTSTHHSFLSYMKRAWGMPALFIHSLFLHTLWKVGFYRFPSPSNG